MRLFAGYDAREAVGWHVFQQSLIETSHDVAVTPLTGRQQDGTNAFTYARFRIPEMCDWGGWALFVDGSDMLLRANIKELMRLKDARFAVQVVKHSYSTRHSRKYIGTDLEADNRDYERKNWSSVILINCSHYSHFKAREKLRGSDGRYLHRFGWLKDEEIGELPSEWNHLVGEYAPNPKAKLVHYTLGVPAFDYYSDCEHADEWRGAMTRALRGMQYDLPKASAR